MNVGKFYKKLNIYIKTEMLDSIFKCDIFSKNYIYRLKYCLYITILNLFFLHKLSLNVLFIFFSKLTYIYAIYNL